MKRTRFYPFPGYCTDQWFKYSYVDLLCLLIYQFIVGNNNNYYCFLLLSRLLLFCIMVSRTVTAFQVALYAFALCDSVVFGLSIFRTDLLYRLVPYFVHQDEHSARYLGYIFLLLGLIRLHGALYTSEKGSYRLTAWSWILELAIHGAEYTKQDIDTHQPKLFYVLTLCSAMLIFTTFLYKDILYPGSAPVTTRIQAQVSSFKDYWRKQGNVREVQELEVAPSSPVADKKAN